MILARNLNILKKYHIKSNEIIFLVLPISIIFSNFFSNLSIYYLGLTGVYIFFKEKEIINKYLLYLILIFWIYISIRSLFTKEVIFSLKSSLTIIRYLFFIVAANYLIENNKNLLKNFSIIFFLFIPILYLDTLKQFYFETNFLGHSDTVNNRISSFFNGRFVLGSYVSKISPLLILLINFFYPFKKFKHIYLFIIISSFFIILISGDRASLGLFFLTNFIIFILLDNNYLALYEKIISIFITLIFIIILIFSVESFKNRFLFQTLSDVSKADKIIFFSKGHQSHWITSYKMYLDNKLFGQGPNMFRFKCDLDKFNSGKKSCSTHPHNYHIQLIGELGLIGYFLFFYLYLKIVFCLLKQFYYVYFKKEKFLSFSKTIILSLTFSNFWPIITTGNFFSSFTMNLIFLPFAFYFINDKKEYSL